MFCQYPSLLWRKRSRRMCKTRFRGFWRRLRRFKSRSRPSAHSRPKPPCRLGPESGSEYRMRAAKPRVHYAKRPKYRKKSHHNGRKPAQSTSRSGAVLTRKACVFSQKRTQNAEGGKTRHGPCHKPEKCKDFKPFQHSAPPRLPSQTMKNRRNPALFLP